MAEAIIPFPQRRRRGRKPLGPYSYLVLRIISQLPPDHCYGLKIEEEISRRMKESSDLSAVYVTLKRLEAKRLVVGKKAPSPSGRKHKVTIYRITARGHEAFQASAPFYQLLHGGSAGGAA